jgi:hypothetical protein
MNGNANHRNVYITNFNSSYSFFNISDFASHDNIKHITSGRLNIHSIKELTRKITYSIADITPDDYVLLCGSTIAQAISLAIIFEKLGSINLLIFDALKNEYFMRKMSVSDYDDIATANK